ncbi:MAG: translation initiation factor IF-2 subunit alpha [Methanophagales archaeon]|nr:translation initiation factor IF-2 subunit alpha [Methanophagales archaeon]
MGRDEWPERGELVVCAVRKLENFGVFVTLEEYGGKEGLIHIAEVSTGWVKHLRDHVREGQKIVCKVLYVDKRRWQIDLSLKAVKEGAKRKKITEWKSEKKAKKWLSLALAATSSKPGISKEELGAIELTFLDAYGSLYDAFEDIVRVGKGVLLELGIKEGDADAIHEVAIANVKLPSVQITGYVELKSPVPDGVEKIKEALVNAEEVVEIKQPDKENAEAENKEKEKDTDAVTVECFYIGAPRYKIRVSAPNYKEAEKVLSDAANTAIEIIKRTGGYGKFHRTLS